MSRETSRPHRLIHRPEAKPRHWSDAGTLARSMHCGPIVADSNPSPERYFGTASACPGENVLHPFALLRADIGHDILRVLAGRGGVQVVDVALAFFALRDQ